MRIAARFLSVAVLFIGFHGFLTYLVLLTASLQPPRFTVASFGLVVRSSQPGAVRHFVSLVI